MSRIYSNALGNVSHREWLQDRANNGSSGEVKRNAQRLLQVVGNDGKMGPGSQVYSTGFDTDGKEHRFRHDYNGLQEINNQMLNAYYSPNAQFGQKYDTVSNPGSVAVAPTGSIYGGGGISAAEARNRRHYNALLESLGGRKAADSQRIDAKYRNSLDRLAQKRDTVYQNPDNEQAKLDNQRRRSIGQIEHDAQNVLQSANTTLGMYGAANSSASEMSAYAAADMANKAASDVGQQYSEQSNEIGLARARAKKDSEQDEKDLNEWKTNETHDLNTKYANLENDYRSHIGGEANLNAIVETFKNLRTPDVRLEKMPEYKAEDIKNNTQMTNVSSPTLTQQQAQDYLVNPLGKKKKEEDQRLF